MTATTLVQRPPGCWVGQAGQPNYLDAILVFDATVKESFRDKNQITRQPVEQGVNITDHVRPEPSELSLDAIISNAPLVSLNFLPGADPASSAYQQLLSLKNNATFLSVSTAIRDYDNMIISSLDVDRDKSTGQVLAVKIGLQSVLIVSALQVAVPAKPSGSPQSQAGNKPTTAASSQQQTKVVSGLGQLTGVHE